MSIKIVITCLNVLKRLLIMFFTCCMLALPQATKYFYMVRKLYLAYPTRTHLTRGTSDNENSSCSINPL